MDQVKSAIEGFKGTIQDAMNDPSSLAPSALAQCASWYGNAVVEKLKEIMAEVEKLFTAFVEVIANMTKPLKDVGETIEDARNKIQESVKGMTALPTMLQEIAGNVNGPKDVADIDTKSMKSSLDTAGISTPLDSVASLK